MKGLHQQYHGGDSKPRSRKGIIAMSGMPLMMLLTILVIIGNLRLSFLYFHSSSEDNYEHDNTNGNMLPTTSSSSISHNKDARFNNNNNHTTSFSRLTNEKSSSTPTSSSISNSKAPFPRWGEDSHQGISWMAIESYIKHASEHLEQAQDLLLCPRGRCPIDMPNVFYIFGATSSSTTGAGIPNVFVERRRRKKVGSGFFKWYPIVEELMEKSLQYLLSTMNDDTNERKKNPYPTLTKYLSLDKTSNQNQKSYFNFSLPVQPSSPSVTQFSSFGIPLIVNLGDNRQCHYENLKKNKTRDEQQDHHVTTSFSSSKFHNVPVFTLAVPAHCNYAFPIPHPAILDSAKHYGHQWPEVQNYRRKKYPSHNQTYQAVWRGSPTGIDRKTFTKSNRVDSPNKNKNIDDEDTPVRFNMAVKANSSPELDSSVGLRGMLEKLYPNNITDFDSKNTSTLIFDVGFGKRLDKVVPPNLLTKMSKKERDFLFTIKGKSRIVFDDFAKYRIILDADGSSWSERFGNLLCLNSVVAKIDPVYVDWLWPELEAGKHYLSINQDSSNLWEVVVSELLQQKEDEDNRGSSRRDEMLFRSNEWCSSRITYSRMIDDLLQTFEKYSTWLDQGDPDWHSKWSNLLSENMPPNHHHWQPLPIEAPKPYFPLLKMGEKG